LPVTVHFDRFYLYAELTEILQAFAAEYPHLASLESIGKSYEGRDIWCMTITNRATGAPEDKPAMYIDANIHAGEVTGSAVALYTINHLLTNFGRDEEVDYLLNNRTFYILPRVNPDGAEKYLTTPYLLRSSVRPYPYPESEIADRPGLHPEDIDGDGRILMMRVRDDERGEWKPSDKDPRLMVKRRPHEKGGPFYRLYPEGFVKDYDGEPFDVVATPWGLDINRNFPAEWSPRQQGAGPYPLSEPETRALAEFIVGHPNIAGVQAYHTTGGVIYRPFCTRPDSEMDPEDLRAFKEIGQLGTDILGYECIHAYFPGGRGPAGRAGIFIDWVYVHRGLIAYTTELWDILGRAVGREEKGGHYDPVTKWDDKKREEVELKILAWNDKHLGGRGFIDWHAFDHPQLGPVELGGWDIKYCRQNPPPEFLEEECRKNCQFTLQHAAALPQLHLQDVEVEPLGERTFRLRARVYNSGYLATSVTNQARKVKACRPDRVELKLPDGWSLLTGQHSMELGFLDGFMAGQKRQFYRYGTPSRSAAKVEWVIQTDGTAGAVTVQAVSERAGRVVRTVRVPAEA